MKITPIFLTLLILFLPHAYPQEYAQWGLPEGAIARLGKGLINAVQYPPDGTRLAVATSIGIWLYDTATYREVALIAGHRGWVGSVIFSPDGNTLASVCGGVLSLWDAVTGENRWTSTEIMEAACVAFSPDGKLLASVSEDGTVLVWKVPKSRF